MSDSVDRVVKRMEDERADPCGKAAAEGRPCFPVETRIKGEEYSVRKSLGLPDLKKDKPVPGSAPTVAEMGPYRPGLEATPINLVSFDPGCVGKRILKSLKGKNDTYYLYRVRDIQGERVALYDRRLEAEKFQGELAFLGKFDGECDAIAAYRHEAAKLPAATAGAAAVAEPEARGAMSVPPRLFVVLAREAPIGVILRRGPAPWYHVILWHTDTDEFEHGAWFKGRIYEERCDLSPDGQLFLYFALQGSRWRTSYKGTWTAISRPPWLQALVLWPHGDTWGGGGRFVDKRKVALWTGMPLATHADHPLVGLEAVSGSRADAGDSFLLDRRLPEREWSGRDLAEERIFTSEGKLFRKRGRRTIELADFNGLKPDPQPAPEWASRPLPPLPSRRKSRAR